MSEKTKTDEPVTRTVKVGMFPYKAQLTGPDGTKRIATLRARRGDTITLIDPADVARGDNNDHFLKDGETLEAGPVMRPVSELGLMTDEEIDDLFRNSRPTVDEILDAVGGDAGLAQRVLQAEANTSDGEGRTTLIAALEKVAGGGS